MADPRSLFRQEAIEYQLRQDGPGELLRVAPRWTGWGYALLFASLAAGLLIAYLVRVDGEPLLTLLFPALGPLLGAANG